MPYPNNVATVTVTGTWIPSNGSTAVPTGIVSFVPNTQLKDGISGQILEQVAVVAPLVNGAISVSLLATDDTHLAPSGWAYTITERIDGQPPLIYTMQFPTAQTPVDLSTKAPVVPAPGLVAYVPLSSVGAAGGVASLDGTGNVPAGQLGNAPGGVPSGTVVTETAYGQAAGAGTATQYSHGDHTHGSPSLTSTAATTSAVGDAAAVGVAATPARADHAHGREAFAAPVASAVGDAQAAGTATSVPRSDHRHAREGFGAVALLTSYGAASTNGSATSVAHSDHSHGTPNWADTFPVSGYVLKGASGNIATYLSVSTMGNNTSFGCRLFVPAGVAFSNLYIAIRDAGVWDGVSTGNTLTLYDDTGTKLDSIADSGTLWTTGNRWAGGTLLGGTQAAQNSDRYIYILPLYRGMSTDPHVACINNPNDANSGWWSIPVGGGNKRCFFLGGLSAAPASFNPVSAGTTTTFQPLVAYA